MPLVIGFSTDGERKVQRLAGAKHLDRRATTRRRSIDENTKVLQIADRGIIHSNDQIAGLEPGLFARCVGIDLLNVDGA